MVAIAISASVAKNLGCRHIVQLNAVNGVMTPLGICCLDLYAQTNNILLQSEIQGLAFQLIGGPFYIRNFCDLVPCIAVGSNQNIPCNRCKKETGYS